MEQDQRAVPLMVRLARDTGIPLVATNDSHYLRREDARSHEVMLCIQTGKTMSDPSRMKWPTPDFYLKSRAEMLALFGELEEALDRTWEIAQRCQVQLEQVKEPFPRFEVPEGHSTDSYFEYVARQGYERRRARIEALSAAGRLKHHPAEYAERLDREIRMIQQMKFSGYFLIVWDFIRFAKSCGIPVGPGRGSAAGSLVSYAMGITDIDPLEYGLLFERFLNPERVSLPDIDIDFCTRRRGEVIQYVTEKYGREQVAQIITIGTLGARAAIKDVGRVLDMSFADVDRITKLVPNVLNISLADAIRMEPGFAQASQKDPRVGEVLEVARRLEGMARNAGVHAAGVVIAPQPLKELVPLYRTNKDEIVTQYDMSGLEKLSLLKMDFLGLTTLTLIHDAVELIEKHRGVKLALEEIPLNDAKTYEIFAKAFTSGIFQFESSGMRDILRRYQPSRIEDLIALNALYRPGPIQGGMVDDFIERKHGRRQITYEILELKDLLEETYGVIVYQEQVMQIANRLAGYSLGEADILRRAMGKKQPEEMARQRERFIHGAIERGHPRRKIEKLFDLMEQFAGYGFNKSHSAAYAYLAYLTAYLKANYPIDFMAALLTSETGNTAKIVKYIGECREMGIRVLPPDINSSEWSFTPDGEAIRFGLGAIKSLGQSGVESILAARREGGRFRSLYEFCERIDLGAVNRRMIESLIKAGALDTLAPARAQLFAAVEGAMESGQKAWRDRQNGQAGLFAEMVAEEPEERPLPSGAGVEQPGEAGGREGGAGLLRHRPPAGGVQRQDQGPGLALHRHAGGPGTRGRGAALRDSDVHPAPAQQGRQDLGRDAARRPARQHRRRGVHHQLRAPGPAVGRGPGGVRQGAGPAGRERAAQDLDPGRDAPGGGRLAVSQPDLDPRAAGPAGRCGRGAGGDLRQEARRDGGPAAPGKPAGFLADTRRAAEGEAGPGVPAGGGAHLRAGVDRETGGVRQHRL